MGLSITVIASEAKQSIAPRKERMDCFVAYAPRNDGCNSWALRRHDFIADNEKLHQIHPPEARGQRDIGGVAAGAHQDAADPRMIVARVERVPLAGQIDLEPAREIHRRRV